MTEPNHAKTRNLVYGGEDRFADQVERLLHAWGRISILFDAGGGNDRVIAQAQADFSNAEQDLWITLRAFRASDGYRRSKLPAPLFDSNEV